MNRINEYKAEKRLSNGFNPSDYKASDFLTIAPMSFDTINDIPIIWLADNEMRINKNGSDESLMRNIVEYYVMTFLKESEKSNLVKVFNYMKQLKLVGYSSVDYRHIIKGAMACFIKRNNFNDYEYNWYA